MCPALCQILLGTELHRARSLFWGNLQSHSGGDVGREGGRELAVFYVDTVPGTYFIFVLQSEISRHVKTVIITVTNICLSLGSP